MSATQLLKIKSLIQLGFKVVNLKVPVEISDDVIIVRDIIIDTSNNEAEIYIADLSHECIAKFPIESYGAIASFVCVRITTNYITRAIEDNEG